MSSGMFNYKDFYEKVANEAPSSGVFVELGCHVGDSTIFLAKQLKALNKKIKFYCVDTWGGCVHTGNKIENTGLFSKFIENVYKENLFDLVIPLKMRTDEAVVFFKDKSIDFTFIDADHHYEPVKKDIELWTPKTKWLLAGHDFQHPPIKQAVFELVKGYKNVAGDVWYIYI